MRILVVDKLASFRKKLRHWLADGGHGQENILEAGSGQAAMDLLRREEFNVDAIVCEWDRETVDAAGLLHQIRSVPGFAHIGFLAVGPQSPAEERAARSAGVTDWLPQPLDPEVLLQKLVSIEKASIAARKRVPSPTTRFRILANEPGKPIPPPAAAMGIAESELRRSTGRLTLRPGELVELHPGAPLHWVESGTVAVAERRAGGVNLEYKASAGQYVGESGFGGFPYEFVAVRAEGEARLATREAPEVERLKGRHPVLFYTFRNIASDRARRFQKASEKSTTERGLHGEVESLPVGDLMGILHGARKTGILRLSGEDRTYYIQFASGTVRHAEANGEVGEEVFYAALLVTRGHFEFMIGPAVEGPVTIASDTATLLLEGLKRRALHVSRAPKPAR